jgi:hypothetical protein
VLAVHEDPRQRYALVPIEAPEGAGDSRDLEGRMRRAAPHRLGATVWKGRQKVGVIVDHATWPREFTGPLLSGTQKAATATLPPGTAFAGIEFTPRGWDLHHAGLAFEDCTFKPCDRESPEVRRLRQRVGKRDIYSGGDDEPRPQLRNPDDGAPLAAYNTVHDLDGTVDGTPDVSRLPAAAQAAALEASFDGLGPRSFHQHARTIHPAALHEAAARTRDHIRHEVHGALLAAAADNAHPAAEAPHPESKADPLGHGQVPNVSPENLDPSGTGSTTAGTSRPVVTAEPAREAIDLLSPTNQ